MTTQSLNNIIKALALQILTDNPTAYYMAIQHTKYQLLFLKRAKGFFGSK